MGLEIREEEIKNEKSGLLSRLVLEFSLITIQLIALLIINNCYVIEVIQK